MNQRGGKVNIVSAGADWNPSDYGLEGIVNNLGRLDSLHKVAELYRKCDIGLVFMFTHHPSYQPLEFMASGCAVVSNYNSSNEWLLKHGVNSVVSEPMPSCIASGVASLIDDVSLRERLVRQALSDIQHRRWESEFEKIYKYFLVG